MILDVTEYAELVLPLGAPEEDWLNMRRQGIGGSDVSGLLGLNNYAGPYKVWLDKTGRAPEQRVSMAMRMGNLLEPVVRQLFIEETGIGVQLEGTLRSKSHPFMQFNPDGLTEDLGIFEAKTSSGWLSHEWENDQVPDHAELQGQHGMAVTGADHAWIAGLLDGRELFIREVKRDQELIDMLVERERRFWQDHVLADVEPLVMSQDLEVLRDLHRLPVPESTLELPEAELRSLRGAYEEAHVAEKLATSMKEEAQARIRQAAGAAEALVDPSGRRWVTLKSGGKLSESRFITEHPDIAAQIGEQKLTVSASAVKQHDPELWARYVPRSIRFPKIA